MSQTKHENARCVVDAVQYLVLSIITSDAIELKSYIIT